MPIEAISSSACTIANRFSPVSLSTRYFWQYAWKASAQEDEGVIGYQAQTVAPPYTQPSAAAALPSTKMRSPTASAARTRIGSGCERCSAAQLRPICRACRLASMSFGLDLYCSATSASSVAWSMSSSTDSAPT